MKRVLIIDTSYPINSRTDKFRTALLHAYDTEVLAWARMPTEVKEKTGYYIYNKTAKPGARLVKALRFPAFLAYAVKVMRRRRPDAIFASHWDSLIVAVILKFFSPNIKIVYDCLDIPTSKSSFVEKSLKIAERLAMNSVHLTVFASRYFPSLYSHKLDSVVFENYPSKAILQDTHSTMVNKEQVEYYRRNNVPIISWIGVVRYPDVVKRLIIASEKIGCAVFIYGDGPSLNKIKSYVTNNSFESFVFFRGRYKQSDLKSIYEATDYVWAAYPTDNTNAIYAISNKYFESSLFQKVPIFSKQTKMAESLKINAPRNVVLVEESDEKKIASTLEYAIQNKFSASKYEPDLFWEDQIQFFLNKFRVAIKD